MNSVRLPARTKKFDHIRVATRAFPEVIQKWYLGVVITAEDSKGIANYFESVIECIFNPTAGIATAYCVMAVHPWTYIGKTKDLRHYSANVLISGLVMRFTEHVLHTLGVKTL